MILGILSFTAIVIGIRLENVTVPQYGIKDGSVTLGCFFDLEKDKLLSLKWYWNQNEFFRYMPSTNPNIATYQHNGVQVDVSKDLLSWYHFSLILQLLDSTTQRRE
jgi:hypothetical protein